MKINQEKLNQLHDWLRKYGPNKYVLVTIVFLIIVFFVGDQSVVNRIRKARQIAELKEQRDAYQKGIEDCQRDILRLQNPDSLERFAREHYYMHTPDEDVYIVED